MAAAEVAVCSRPWHQYDDIRGGERQGIPPAAAAADAAAMGAELVRRH